MIGVGAPGSQGTSTSQNLFLGNGSSAGTGGTALGYKATAGVNSVAVGTNSLAKGPYDTAIGFNATDNASGGVAIGANTSISASANNATAIGYGATVGANGANSVAIGANSVANDPNVVSFGSPGNERRLVNVAAAVSNTDAANFAQVKTAYAGVAMAFAMTSVQPSLNTGEQAVSVGVGSYIGQTAFSLHYSAKPTDHIFVGASVGYNGNDVGGSAGIGYKW